MSERRDDGAVERTTPAPAPTPAPAQEPAQPPPGKRALTDYLPPPSLVKAVNASRGHTAIHRPPAPQHQRRGAAPAPDVAPDDPFGVHLPVVAREPPSQRKPAVPAVVEIGPDTPPAVAPVVPDRSGGDPTLLSAPSSDE